MMIPNCAFVSKRWDIFKVNPKMTIFFNFFLMSLSIKSIEETIALQSPKP